MHPGRKVTLVCGGGGVWGVAWMTGVVLGLAERGLDVREAVALVGTSAGSVISAQLASGLAAETLFERQSDPAKQPREPAPPAGGLQAMMELSQHSWRDGDERVRALCKLGLEAETITPAERRANIAERLGLPGDAWPAKALSLTAVDADSCELTVFDASSGVSLVDAVAASCAIPGVWPPTPINGRRYIDGGLWRTAENAHLAAGSAAVLILSPMGRVVRPGVPVGGGLAADVARLEAQGAKVVVIAADDASLATMAPGPLDPATRQPAAAAGRLQGQREVSAARAVYS